MANLYNKAGLVNIPVGYSDGFLYNIKPVDDTLAFRFNRNSSATRVNKQGLIEQVSYFGPELVTNGDFATDSDWSLKSGSNISGGSLNFDGTQTSIRTINQSITSLDLTKIYKVTFTISNYTAGRVKVKISNNAQGTNKTANGTYVEYLSGMTSTTLSITASNGFAGSIDNVSVVEVLGDKPRIDYTDSLTSPSFLLEPQSTNLITHSEDFSSLNIRSNAVVTSNVIVSPSGLLDADEITFDGTSTGRVEETIPATVGQSYTISLYLKNKDLSDKTQVWIGFSAAAQGSYVTITDEWQRYDITTTANGTNEYPRVQFSGTGSLYAWGFQVEQLTYPTSYIPTYGSTATRVAETCNGAGNASTFNDSEGVLYAEIAALDNDGSTRRLSISDGTNNNRVLIGYSSSNRFQFVVSDGGSVVVNKLITVSNITQFNKVAFKYKLNDCAIWINGQEVGTDPTATMPSGLDLLNFDQANGTEDFYGKTKGVYVFNKALTDDELQQLTGPEYNSFAALAAAYNYTVI